MVKAYFWGLKWDYIPSSVLACIIGDQNGMGTGIGCQAMWFVYTLLLAKILANFIQRRWFLQSIICICFLMGAVFLSQKDVHMYSSYANLLVSYPFFIFGYYIRKEKESTLLSFVRRVKAQPLIGILLAVFCAILCFCVSMYNGMAQMYDAHFGNYVSLFLLGGMLGTVMLASLAILMERFDFNGIVSTYSKGTVIVLAWQVCFISIIDNLFIHF